MVFSRVFFALLCPIRFSFLEVWLYLPSSSSFLPLFKEEDEGGGGESPPSPCLDNFPVLFHGHLVTAPPDLADTPVPVGASAGVHFAAHFADVFLGPPSWPALEHFAGGERLQPLLPFFLPPSILLNFQSLLDM